MLNSDSKRNSRERYARMKSTIDGLTDQIIKMHQEMSDLRKELKETKQGMNCIKSRLRHEPHTA